MKIGDGTELLHTNVTKTHVLRNMIKIPPNEKKVSHVLTWASYILVTLEIRDEALTCKFTLTSNWAYENI